MKKEKPQYIATCDQVLRCFLKN